MIDYLALKKQRKTVLSVHTTALPEYSLILVFVLGALLRLGGAMLCFEDGKLQCQWVVSKAKRSTNQCISAQVLIWVTQGADWLQTWQVMGVRTWI